MTPNEVIYQTLTSTGVPGTYAAYQEGNVPPLPWFVYIRDRGGEVFADDSNYAELPRYRVELYMAERDSELIETFSNVIKGRFGPCSTMESWILSEHVLMVVYEFTYTK